MLTQNHTLMNPPNEISSNRLARRELQIISRTTKVGLAISAAYIGFFLLMRLFQLENMLWLRSFNGIFLFAGLIVVFKEFKHRVNGKIEYLEGMRLGLRTTIISLVPFTVFMFFTLRFNPEFMTFIQQTAWSGAYMAPGSAAGMILIEGLVSGFIMTYIMMMSLKTR